MNMKLLSLIQNTPIPIIILDKSGKVLNCNKAMIQWMGYKKKNIEETEFWKLDIIKRQKSKKIKSFFYECIDQGQSKIEEFQIKTKNRGIKWVSLIGNTFYLEHNQYIQILFNDITKRKEIEGRLDLLEKEITDVIFVLDLDLNHEYLSPSVEALRGFTPKEAMNLAFEENYTPASQKKVLNLKEKYLAPEKLKDQSYNPTITENIEVYCKDGSIIPIEIKMRLIRDKNGKASRIIGVTRDISERRRAEERYKKLFQTTRDAIMTLEPPKWNFTSGNPAAVEMFGAKNEDDFQSRAPWEFSTKVQPDGQNSIKKARKMIDKAMKEGSNFFEWEHKRLNGETFPATVLLSRIEISGKRFLQATVRDITDRKRAERKLKKSREKLEILNNRLEEKVRQRTKKLKQSEQKLRSQNIKLKRLSTIKDDFITMVAHELKTPIASIYGYIDYILSIYPNHDDAELKADLKTAQRNVKRLRKYVNQLLDVMKIEESKIKLNKSSVNFRKVINSCIEELNYLFKQKNLHLDLDIEEELIVFIDKDRIFQVCSNLISNSVKFTPKGGNIAINAYKEDKKVFFKIQDNGIGLTEKEINSIFKKFEKYDVGVDNYPRGKGTGLGLFISKGIVEAHNGKIWASSEGKRKGSKFTFYLPLE